MIKSTSNVTTYVIAMISIAIFTMLAVLAVLFLRPDASDNVTYIATIISVATPIIGVLIALLQRENHLAMNSRLDQMLTLTRKSARAEGVLEGSTESKK